MEQTKKAVGKITKNWCFTWHNFTEENIKNLKSLKDKDIDFIIFGIEKTKNEIQHLQGYVELKKKSRITGCKKILDPVKESKSEIHIEPAKAENRRIQIEYCSKGEQSHKEYEEQGLKGPNYGKNAVVYSWMCKDLESNKYAIELSSDSKKDEKNQGKAILKMIKDEKNFKEIAEVFPDVALKNASGIDRLLKEFKNEKMELKVNEKLSKIRLFPWQIILEKELEEEPDDRKIIWIYGTKGGEGKTTFAKYIKSKGNCKYFNNAKTADIAFAYRGERVVIFDICRSSSEAINYEIIEQVKNGLIFSSKYTSEDKLYETPHIIILANIPPNISKLSLDRWDIRELKNNNFKDVTKKLLEKENPVIDLSDEESSEYNGDMYESSDDDINLLS